MKAGLTGKVLKANMVIIAAMLISSIFSVYVVTVNLHTNHEIQQVTLPYLEHLKNAKDLMPEIKKLSNTWTYIPNNIDQEKLLNILNAEYPKLDSSLQSYIGKSNNAVEEQLFAELTRQNKYIIDSARAITLLLNSPVSYINDSLSDRAADLSQYIDSAVSKNDKKYETLIHNKEVRLSALQQKMTQLLNILYVAILFSALVIVAVTIISYRYSRDRIIKPVLDLNRSIQKMPVGEVVSIGDMRKNDEIGEMYDAVNQMINSIIQKINFAEQIGKGNYDADFELLSGKDKLGMALLSMRDDLKKSNIALIEQGKMLLEAQKLSRTGNYFYNIETGELKTSGTFDDIVGIDSTFPKQQINWRDHILPEFHAQIAEKAVKAIKERTQLSETYLLKRYNDGKKVWVHTIGEYNYDNNGRAISMFGTMQDVTESKTLELELNASYNIAREQNNRLLNFSYIVSHNLRMHTVNIHSLLGLYNEATSEEEKNELINYMRISSEQLNDTMHYLNEVVAMQQSQQLKLEPIKLRDAIDHTISLLMPNIIDKNAIVKNEVGDDVIVNYNPIYMDSILLNFLSNAIKYSRSDTQPQVVFTCHKNSAEQWVLEIADNGLGIDLTINKDKLFGMYKTFHGNKDAKGIGLFMTKYQVEAMGGNIEVDSKVGAGTTFKVYIK
jgi:signal transduction histidine kinase/cell division protein FtsL